MMSNATSDTFALRLDEEEQDNEELYEDVEEE